MGSTRLDDAEKAAFRREEEENIYAATPNLVVDLIRKKQTEAEAIDKTAFAKAEEAKAATVEKIGATERDCASSGSTATSDKVDVNMEGGEPATPDDGLDDFDFEFDEDIDLEAEIQDLGIEHQDTRNGIALLANM